MAMPSLLSSLTNYPKWHCQIVGEMFSMMNVPSNQPIKKESLALLDKWGGKAVLCQGDSPICFFIPLRKEGKKQEVTVLCYRLYLPAWLTLSYFLPWPGFRFRCKIVLCFCSKAFGWLSTRLIESKTGYVLNESQMSKVFLVSLSVLQTELI